MPEGTLPKQAEGLPPSLGRPAEMLLTMSGPFIDREYSDPSLKEHLTSFTTLLHMNYSVYGLEGYQRITGPLTVVAHST